MRHVQRLMCITLGIFSLTQPGSPQDSPTGKMPELRLGYTADAMIYPSSINEHAITVYRDPSDARRRFYIKPIFMPSWETFAASVADACSGNGPEEEKTVPLRVQFSSRRLNDEVVALLNRNSTPQISLGQLFSYPIYALFVVSGARDPSDTVSTKIQFRYPSGISEALPTGVVAAIDAHLTNLGMQPPLRMKESCMNLGLIAANRDLGAYAYAEYSEVKLNAATAVISAFAQTRIFADLDRDEGAAGVIRVTSRSGSRGVGFNFGGTVAGSRAQARSVVDQQDTRRRFVSANIVQDAAENAVLSGAVFARVEALEFLDSASVVNSLMTFMLSEAPRVRALIERRQDGQWSIVAGEHSRTLGRDEVKVLMESAPTSELTASGKEQMDCSLMTGAAGGAAAGAAPAAGGGGGGKQCGAERAATMKFSDAIKWQRDGNEWVPTAVDLYVINTQSLRSRATMSVEQAIVTAGSQAQIHTLLHVTDAEPTNYLVDQMDRRIESLVAKIDGPKKQVTSFPGGLYKTISYYGTRGSGNQVFNCQPPLQPPGPQWEQVGGSDSAVYDQRNFAHMALAVGCRGGGTCNSSGEWCVSYHRTPGCFVTKDWLGWYRDRKKKLGSPEVVAEICAQPL